MAMRVRAVPRPNSLDAVEIIYAVEIISTASRLLGIYPHLHTTVQDEPYDAEGVVR